MSKPIVNRHKSAKAQIYDWLKEEIVSGTIPPGTILDKNELIEKLDTSLTPLREALLLLKSDGFVDLIPNLHTIVRLIDFDELRQHVFIRASLECAIAEKLANDGIGKPLEKICKNLIERQKKALEKQDFSNFFKLDQQFHSELCESIGYDMLWPEIDRHRSHINRACQCCPANPATIEISIAQHSEIIDKIIQRDVSGARELMKLHAQMIYDDLKRIEPQFLLLNKYG